MESLKTWLHKTVNKMSENTIKSITGNNQCLNSRSLKTHFQWRLYSTLMESG